MAANPDASKDVLRFTFEIETGDDDLRKGSDATGFVIGRDSQGTIQKLAAATLNRSLNWKNWTTNRADIPFPTGITLSQATEVGIDFSGGAGIGADNWNMKSISVFYFCVDGSNGRLLQLAASPYLFRFGNGFFHWKAAIP